MHKGYPKNIVVLLLTLAPATLCAQQQRFSVLNNFGRTTAPYNERSMNEGLIMNTVLPGKDTYQSTFAGLKAAARVSPGWVRSTHDVISKPPGETTPAKDMYVKNFGFFCKKELQLEKTLRVPLRIRVGSLEQCNFLEQKR